LSEAVSKTEFALSRFNGFPGKPLKRFQSSIGYAIYLALAR